MHLLFVDSQIAPQMMDDSLFDDSLYFDQPPVSPPLPSGAITNNAELSQGRIPSSVSHGWPSGGWEPNRRTGKEPRKTAAQVLNPSAPILPSGSKPGHPLVKQFLNFAQRARNSTDERLDEVEKR